MNASTQMNIYIASDHRGFEMKDKLVVWLKTLSYTIIDCGPQKYRGDDDYPDITDNFVRTLIKDPHFTSDHQGSLGILLCGSGVGVTVAANRYRAIICALGFDAHQAAHARENDHANVLSLPAEYISFEQAREIVSSFLHSAPKREEKYERRVNKLRRNGADTS